MNKLLRAAYGAALAMTVSTVYAANLDDAIASAEKNDPSLASAQANRDAAYENIAIARAKLLPQTSFSGTYQKIQEGVRSEGTSAGNSALYQINAYNYQFSLRQGLYHPRDWAGYDIGQLQSEYGTQKLASARSDLWQRTANSWLDVLAAADLSRIYGDTVKTTGFAAEQAQKRFKAGDGTRDAVIEAQAQYALAQSQLAEAEITLRSREQTFKLLTGSDADNLRAWHLPDYRKAVIGVENKAEFMQLAASVNPEILAAQAAQQVNKQRAKQARADRLPTVDLIASKSWAQSDTIATLNQLYNTLGAGIQVSIPLYDGGGLSATQNQAEASARASTEDLRAQQLKLATQVEMDWSSVEASVQRAHSAELLLTAAQEQKRSAELGLKAGQRTWGDVAQAEILIARRASDYLNYVAGVLRSQAKLLSVLPVTENVWEPWVAEVSALAKPQ